MSVEPELREDARFYPLLVKLAGCVCEELESSGLKTCWCGILSGDAIDTSRVSPEAGGIGWARVTGIAAGAQQAGPEGAGGSLLCSMPLEAQLEVGFADCYRINDDGTPLDVTEELEATRRLMAGSEALYRAAFCCDWVRNMKRRVTPGQMVPGGPQGGVIYVSWSLSLAVG